MLIANSLMLVLLLPLRKTRLLRIIPLINELLVPLTFALTAIAEHGPLTFVTSHSSIMLPSLLFVAQMANGNPSPVVLILVTFTRLMVTREPDTLIPLTFVLPLVSIVKSENVKFVRLLKEIGN